MPKFIGLLTVVILYIIIGSCSGDPTSGNKKITIYCVSLTSSFDDVCQGYNFTEKNTLYHYMKNPSEYFKSYETSVFESGHHSPVYHFTLTINTVTNLTLIGLNKAKAIIDCNGTDTKFLFKGSSNIIIESLIFNSCVPRHKPGLHGGSATIIVFYNTTNISMLNVSVLKCVDNAFLILNTIGSVVIDNVEVANCSTNKNRNYFVTGNSIICNHCHNGTSTNISIKNSRFIHNVNSLEQVNLELAREAAGGLTVVIKCPNLKVKIFNTTMLDNVGYNGGNLAIIIFYTTLNSPIKIASSKFEEGSASNGAGMMVTVGELNFPCKDTLYQRKLLHVYNTNFTNNVAKAGSGVYMKYYDESLQKCNAMNLVTFEYVSFINNSVNCTACWGGIAFQIINLMVTDYLYHGNPQIQVVLNNCNFQSNYVKSLNSATGVVFVKPIHSFQLINSFILYNKATGI